MTFRQLDFLPACAAALSAPGDAETDITILHVNNNVAATALWDRIAADYEKEHPGVKVQFKYLENEAFKAKLPTMLQSDDSRPSAFYSWGGGVMQAQDKAGFLRDISAEVAATEKNLASTADEAFKVDGKAVGVPYEVGEVAFFYNKKLFEKAGVKGGGIKTSGEFFSRRKKNKDA